jgi:pimeloyl-ACP methyl ester carboxylesterase
MAPSNRIFTSRAALARRDVIAVLALGVAAPFVVRGAVAREPGIVPFRYAANDDALADLKQRLRHTRLPDDETTSDWSQGVPRARRAEQHAPGLKPNLGQVELPVGCTIFPHDFHAPRRWAEQFFPNPVYWNEAERGGHFAPLEVPELFVRELRNCFWSQRLS